MAPRDVADELDVVRRQLEIYEAIAVAAENAHSALDVMLTAPDEEAACQALGQRFGFTETQALAVAEIQFRRMTERDRQKINDRCVDLREVQIAARHADPRTTMRYDRARNNLDRDPNYILAAFMASAT